MQILPDLSLRGLPFARDWDMMSLHKSKQKTQGVLLCKVLGRLLPPFLKIFQIAFKL
jgi:hypothetical protein